MSLCTGQVCYLGDNLISEDMASFILCISILITPLTTAPNINISRTRQSFFPIQVNAVEEQRAWPCAWLQKGCKFWWLSGTYSLFAHHHRVCRTSSFAFWRQAGTNQEYPSQTLNTLSHYGIHFLVLLILPNWVARGAWSITEYLLCNFGCL